MTAIDLRNDEWVMVAEALESEIEHTNDLVKETDDEETIRTERTRQAHLEAIREYILSVHNLAVASAR